MPRTPSPKPRYPRQMLVGLDIVDLVRNGWLSPGVHNGVAESLRVEFEDRGYFVPFAAQIGPESGFFRVFWPLEQDLQVRPLAVKTAARAYWRFVCPGCAQLTRRLLAADLSLLDPRRVGTGPWECRRCYRVVYPDSRRAVPSREFRAQLRRYRAAVEMLEGHAAWTDATLRALAASRAAEGD